MSLERINLEALGLPAGPYSHAVRHGATLYTSGFTAFGTVAEKGAIEDQAREIFAQLARLARSQGTALDRLVKVTLFVTSLDRIGPLREVLEELYQGHRPASSLIQAAGLFSRDLKIEVEAVFAL